MNKVQIEIFSGTLDEGFICLVLDSVIYVFSYLFEE